MIPTFKKLFTERREVQQFQENVAEVLDFIGKKEILDGTILKDVAVLTSTTNINHGLGRELIGWIIIGKSLDARVWDEQSSNDEKTRVLALKASAAVTVSIWVF